MRRRRETADDLIPESDLAATVDELATLLGWKNYGVLEQKVYARRLSKGYPDRTLTRGGRLIFAELKSQQGRISPEQQAWLDALAEVPGVEIYVWRPSDRDRIELILQ